MIYNNIIYSYKILHAERTKINCFDVRPPWKKFHLLSERLASLGIEGAQLKAPLKPLNTVVL